MDDEHAMKDITENMFKYQGAIIKYCQNMLRKTPFVKDMLRRLRDASEEPEKIQSNELFIIGHNYPPIFHVSILKNPLK